MSISSTTLLPGYIKKEERPYPFETRDLRSDIITSILVNTKWAVTWEIWDKFRDCFDNVPDTHTFDLGKCASESYFYFLYKVFDAQITNINNVNENGFSCLHITVLGQNREFPENVKPENFQLYIAKALINAGAYVNLTAGCISALWLAIKETDNADLIIYLILQGGRISYDLDGPSQIKMARLARAIFQKPKVLLEGISDIKSPLYNFPKDVVHQIALLSLQVFYCGDLPQGMRINLQEPDVHEEDDDCSCVLF